MSPDAVSSPEEPPAPPTHVLPRGTVVMAIVRWVLLAAVSALAVWNVYRFWGQGARSTSEAGPARYYCPMHPEIRSADPGECPICHMDLEPIPADRTRPTGPMGAALARNDAGRDAGAGADASSAARVVVPVTLAPERIAAMGIATVAVVSSVSRESLRVPGSVEVPENGISRVHVRAPGFIERVAVSETSVHVARGQALAWYYSPEIYQAQQELLTAQRWATPGANTDAGAIGGATANAAATAATRRRLELLGLSLSDIHGIVARNAPLRSVAIRAPRAGYVIRRTAVLGAYAMPENALYEIADLSTVWVVANVDERDVTRVPVGLPAQIVLTGAGAATIDARVARIEPAIDTAARTARVRLEVRNPTMALRPGSFVDVTFDVGPVRSLTVPRDALIDTGEATYVFVDAGEGRFEPHRVRVGRSLGDLTELIEGVHEGDRVVARGGFVIDSESRLQGALTRSTDADGGAR